MAKITYEIISTSFLKGSDIDKNKFRSYIQSKDKYYVFYISEFEKIFNLKIGKIRTILKQLEKENIIKKFKSYPIFWKMIKEWNTESNIEETK